MDKTRRRWGSRGHTPGTRVCLGPAGRPGQPDPDPRPVDRLSGLARRLGRERVVVLVLEVAGFVCSQPGKRLRDRRGLEADGRDVRAIDAVGHDAQSSWRWTQAKSTLQGSQCGGQIRSETTPRKGRAMGSNRSGMGGPTRRSRARVGPPAVLLACAVAGVFLFQPGLASAASRGFRVLNVSSHSLRVVSAKAVPSVFCYGTSSEDFGCQQSFYQMAFEGRPADGTVLTGGHTQRWELKYYFNFADYFGAQYNYAAKLTYKVVGTAATYFEATIFTSNYVNDSSCKIIPKQGPRGNRCTAAGLRVTFR
jgi:hypothetical protein